MNFHKKKKKKHESCTDVRQKEGYTIMRRASRLESNVYQHEVGFFFLFSFFFFFLMNKESWYFVLM